MIFIFFKMNSNVLRALCLSVFVLTGQVLLVQENGALEFKGDAEIFINNKSIGKVFIAKTIPATYSIEEIIDVGQDTGLPIIEDTYAVPFENKTLEKLTVIVGD